jgi:hypothetical protein
MRIFAVCFLAITAAAATRDNREILQKYQPAEVDVSNIAQFNRTHRDSNLWLTVTNWGFLGNLGMGDPEAMSDPELYNQFWAPQCEFPGGSGIQYLFAGGVWVGALVDTGGVEFPRVSVGTEGWTGPSRNQYELEPGEVGGQPLQDHGILERSNLPGAVNYLGQPIYSPEAVAPQEFISTFCDTLTETFWVGSDIMDGPHFPLGLKVTQKSMVWNSYGFDDFVIIEMTVENIGSRFLKNPYLGFLIDADVGHKDEPLHHEDDVAGYLHDYLGQVVEIPYIADNDGRPHDINQGNDFTCPGVSGLHLLAAPQDTFYSSFNWWISNGNPDLDYGPHWVDDGSQGGWTTIYGTPDGDARKYFLMSNKEMDFDQWWVADNSYLQAHPQVYTDPFTGQTTTHDWALENLSIAPDLANGYDTRYLVSYGPLGIFDHFDPTGNPIYRLNPGESTQVAFAYICADGFHDPNNPQGDVSGNNPIDPTKYVYADLAYNVAKAQWLYDTNFQFLPPVAPNNLRAIATPDSAVWLAWDSYPVPPTVTFNLFRRLEGQSYPPGTLNASPITDTTFADLTALPGQHYYYKAQAVGYDTLLSYPCPEIPVTAAAPLTPTGLAADSSANTAIYLSWNANFEPDLNHYLVYRRDTSAVYQLAGNVPAGTESFGDQGLTNGLEYTYRISAVDNNGYESALSDSVSDIPMGFTQDLLIIREKNTSGIYEWPDNLLEAYYQQLFIDIGENPDFMTIQNNSTPTFAGLPQLSPYKIVWLIHDYHALCGDMNYVNSRSAILAQYIENGGKVIVSGRNLFYGAFRFSTTTTWLPVSSSHFLNHDFKLDFVYAAKYPNIPNPPDFIAGIPAAGFPSVWVDSNKVNLISSLIPLFYPNREALLEVDGMIPDLEGETFYTFQSYDPDSSALHGHAVGVRYLTPNFANVILTFPLFAMQPYDSVKALAERLLGDIRLGMEDPEISPTVLPSAYSLKSVRPNPFNPTTVISYQLPAISRVNLKVYDAAGRMVATLVDGWRAAGAHEVTFDGQGLASGMYFVKMMAGDYVSVQKMVLLK